MFNMYSCENCGREYPEHLVQLLVMENYSKMICPICAINLIRTEHGLPDFSFRKGSNIKRLTEAVHYNRDRFEGSTYGEELLI